MKAKPCPVCGYEKVEVWQAKDFNDYLVVCPKCNFSFSEQGLYGEWPEDAINLWNEELTNTENYLR